MGGFLTPWQSSLRNLKAVDKGTYNIRKVQAWFMVAQYSACSAASGSVSAVAADAVQHFFLCRMPGILSFLYSVT